MAYTKYFENWEDLPSTNTPIVADAMNNIENGIKDVSDFLLSKIQVEETGSNSNGSWIKYSDGTMLCYGIKQIGNVAVNNPFGVLYASNSINLGNFPQTFISAPTCLKTLNSTTGLSLWITNEIQANTTYIGDIKTIAVIQGNPTNVSVSWSAFGRWK